MIKCFNCEKSATFFLTNTKKCLCDDCVNFVDLKDDKIYYRLKTLSGGGVGVFKTARTSLEKELLLEDFASFQAAEKYAFAAMLY